MKKINEQGIYLTLSSSDYNSHEKEILNPSLIILDKINMKY